MAQLYFIAMGSNGLHINLKGVWIMGIRYIAMDFAGQIGVYPRLGRMETTDILSVLIQAGYINNNMVVGGFLKTDLLFVAYSNGMGGIAQGMFSLNFSPTGVITLTGAGGQTVDTVEGTDNQIVVSPNIGNVIISIVPNPIIPGLAAMTVPSGLTSDRPISPENGDFRYNNEVNVFEGFADNTWHTFSEADGFIMTITGTADQIIIDNTIPSDPIISISSNPILTGTGAITIPQGTIAQQTTPENGLRYNSETGNYEGYYPELPGWQSFSNSGGTITSVIGTENQITATAGPDVVLAIQNDPIFSGNASAESFNSIGLGDIPGEGTLTVTNGSTIISGSGTSFLRDVGYNSTIKILGTPYTINEITGDDMIMVSEPYEGTDGVGVPYFIDGPMSTMTTSNGVQLGGFANSGALIYGSIPFLSYTPAIMPSALGGVTSLFSYSADNHFFNIDSGGQLLVNVNGSSVFTLSGTGDGTFAGNLAADGNLRVGAFASPGATFSMPTNSFDTYSPNAVSSNTDGFSYWDFYADNIRMNIDIESAFSIVSLSNGDVLKVNSNGDSNFSLGQSYQFDVTNDGNGDTQLNFNNSTANLIYDGNAVLFRFSNDILSNNVQNYSISLSSDGSGNAQLKMGPDDAGVITFIDGLAQIQGQFTANGTVQSAYKYALTGTAFDGSSDSNGGAAQILIHNSPGNIQFGLTDMANLLTPPDDTRPIARWVMGASTIDFSIVSTDGSVNLPLYFQRDFGPSEFFGWVSVGNDLPAYKLDIQDSDAAIHMGANSGIPPTPIDGGVWFVQFDEGLGKTLPFFKDTNGDVTQLGEGTGGGGTVTLVAVTSDLTIDGVPSESFTVDGTIGLAPTTVSAGSYTFGDGGFTVDANGRITAASNSTDFGTVTSVASNNGIVGGTITTTGTLGMDPTWLFFDTGASNAFILTGGNSITTGVSNTGSGNLALFNTQDGSYNTASGESSLGANVSGNYNTADGYHAFWTAQINYGTAIGANSGLGNLTGDYATFVGYNTGVVDSSDWGNTNHAAFGHNTKVGASNTYAYGDGTVSHIFGATTANSTMHIKSNATSGSMGSRGVLRLNGTNDPDNTWPVSDIVWMQNEIVQDGVVTNTILTIPISNALGGCITNARIKVSCILGNGGPGISSYSGEINVLGAFDGSPGAFYINGVSTLTPVVITLNPGTTDATLALASATVSLTGTTGPSSQNLIVQVTGINANFVNWNAYCEYFTTQSTSNV